MTYSDSEARWRLTGGAARASYGLFLQDLCDLLATLAALSLVCFPPEGYAA